MPSSPQTSDLPTWLSHELRRCGVTSGPSDSRLLASLTAGSSMELSRRPVERLTAQRCRVVWSTFHRLSSDPRVRVPPAPELLLALGQLERDAQALRRRWPRQRLPQLDALADAYGVPFS